MDLNLTDLQDTQQPDISEFKLNTPQGFSINERSAAQLAGGDTLLNSGSVEDFKDTKRSLLTPETREEFTVKQQRIREDLFNDAQSSIVDILSSPTISDEEKAQSLVASRIDVKTLPPVSSLDVLAEEAAIADSEEDETERSAEARFSALNFIGSENKKKIDLMSRINALKLGQDASALRTLREIGELIVPFAENKHIADTLGELTGDRGGALTPLGHRKKELFSLIEKTPVNQRPALTEKILQVIEENPDIILSDGNDIANLDILNRMLIDNDYSDVELWFDSVTSVLDVLGVGALIKSSAKSLRGGRGLAKAERRLAQEVKNFTNSPKEAITPLEEEALAFKNRQENTPSALEQEAKDFVNRPERVETTLEAEAKAFKSEDIPDIKLAEEAEDFKSTPEPTEDSLFRRAMGESVRTEVAPTSPSQVIKDVNPGMARQINKLAIEDETEEAAKALYGSSREEALAKDLLPEPDINGGRIPNKVEMRSSPGLEPEDIRKARQADGNIVLNDNELTKVVDKLINRLDDVEGMVLHPSSMIVRRNLDATFNIGARFSPVDSGFATAQEALDRAQFAFRNYRIPPEAFKILAREGSDWVPTTLKDVEAKTILRKSKPGIEDDVPQLKDVDFAVGLDYDYRFRPEDLTEVDLLTTAPGFIARTVQFLDRAESQFLASVGQGSLVQHLLSPIDVLHPQIVGAASVAVDKTHALKKLYVEEVGEFVKNYKGLSKARRTLIDDYIHEANFEGLKLDVTDLYSRGFSSKEIETLRQWRKAQDVMWHAANDDMAQTLRSRGEKVFSHKGSDTKLMGRPIQKSALSKDDVVFDPTSNSLVKPDGKNIDELYEGGGTVFRLSEPLQVDGRWADVVIARNTPDAGFVRSIYEGERVLAYRDGYFPVIYDALFFVEKVIKVDGKEVRKVIASAKDRGDLNKALEALRTAEPDATFTFKKDRSINKSNSRIFDEGAWSLSSNAGLTSQRFRGQRIGDAGANLQNFGKAHLKDPLEAIAQQIFQLSRRVSMRNFLDTAKRRWMLTYGDFVELPRNKLSGQIELPSKPSQIRAKAGAPSKLVADARTNFNYLYGLENGYINGIDATYKALLHIVAEALGESGLFKTERALIKTAEVNPVQSLKTAAFKLFLSASPLRQSVLQRGQIVLLGSVNPKYVTTSLIKDIASIQSVRFGISKDPKALALFDEIKNTGVLEAVDSNNLIRSDMLRLADRTALQKTTSAIGAPLRFTQKVGFDLAEQDNLISSWLAHRDLAIKAGKNVKDQRVKDEILAQARAFTGNMNRAGEMPYSQNTLGLFAQFLSFRHKMLLQPFTSRALSVKDRAKLLALTTVVFGTDATIIKVIMDQVYDGSVPTETKDKIEDGLLDFALNAALSAATGTQQAIDFGDLAPTEAFGMWNMLSGMFSTDLGEVLANAPATSLLLGSNPRLTDAFSTTARYFNLRDDYDDPVLQTTFPDVVRGFMSTFSGTSTLMKSNYAARTGQKLSAYGRITDDEVTKTEAVAALFGFRTKTETGFTDVKKILFGERSFENDDIVIWYNELKRQLSRRGVSPVQDDLTLRILSEAHRVFSDDRPRFQEILTREIEKDALDGNYVMFKTLMSRIGLKTEEEMWELINLLPAGTMRNRLTETMLTMKEMVNGN